KRSSGNTRLFSEEDVDQLEEVIYLTHQLGINLAGVEMILKLKKQISKMQKDMNKLFDQTQEELDKESELAKTGAKASLKQLMTIKQEKAPAEQKQISTTPKDRPAPKKIVDAQKTIAQEIDDTIDHWDIE